MPLEIVKSILLTGIRQAGHQAIISCFNYRDDRRSHFNVTVKDFSRNELRAVIDWQFVIDHTDPFNSEVLQTISQRRQESIDKEREDWKDEEDPKVLALVQQRLTEPPVFCLRHMGDYPGAIIVGMGAMLFARGHGLFVSDALGEITDISIY